MGACLTRRGDELFELCDGLPCSDGPVRTVVDLALVPEHRRGHGALHGGLNRGRVDDARLRSTPAGLPLPRPADGRLVLAGGRQPVAAAGAIRMAKSTESSSERAGATVSARCRRTSAKGAAPAKASRSLPLPVRPRGAPSSATQRRSLAVSASAEPAGRLSATAETSPVIHTRALGAARGRVATRAKGFHVCPSRGSLPLR